jgi:hypothetical protein
MVYWCIRCTQGKEIFFETQGDSAENNKNISYKGTGHSASSARGFDHIMLGSFYQPLLLPLLCQNIARLGRSISVWWTTLNGLRVVCEPGVVDDTVLQ